MRRVLVVAAMALLAASPAAARQPAATVTVRSSAYGPILFDGPGRALYAFTRDAHGPSACYGACAKAWPAYVQSGSLAPGPGTKRSLLGVTRRRDGRRQVTYAGRPLYRHVGDDRGEVRCQNVSEFGGFWLVVRGSGRLVR